MDEASAGTTFRMWLRRHAGGDAPYALRFEVSEGKGLLRVVRPGVLIDPPARQSAQEDGLTAGQVRASRFLLLRESARNRVGHDFSRLDDLVLERLAPDRWVELRPIADAGRRQLVVVDERVGIEGELVDDEPTSPQRMLADLRDQLAAPPVVEVADDDTPIAPQGVPSQGDHVEAELADWAGTFEVRESVPLAPRLLATEVVVQPDETTGVEPIPALGEADPPDVDGSVLHERRTTLVRFFRRRQARDNQRILELEAKLRAVSAKQS